MHASMTLGAAVTTGDEPGPLDKNTKKVSEGRRGRYALRDFLRSFTKLHRIAKCGHVHVDRAPTVRLVKTASGRAWFEGVLVCHNLWVCPVCADRIAQKRAANLEDLMGRWILSGGALCFQTLTLPHSFGDGLGPTLSAVTESFRGVLSGRGWKDIEARFGIEGHLRVLEVTVGKNGWHPHLHILFFTKSPLPPEQLRHLQGLIYDAFRRRVTRRGLKSPDPRNCPLLPVGSKGLGRYLAKVTAAAELACWHTKKGRNGNRSPFQLLNDAMVNAEPSDLALWAEWEETMPGRRQMTWSKGFEKRLKALPQGSQQADEGIDEKFGVARISRELWRRIRRRRGLDTAVLEAAELGGYEPAARLLLTVVGSDLDDFSMLHFIQEPEPPPKRTIAELIGIGSGRPSELRSPTPEEALCLALD